ncbi:MAG: ZIP family metal transporter [Evtepia gabavorous]
MLDSFSQLAFPVQALIATLFTWALTSLGACVVFFMRQPNRNVMDAMLGLAGGVMVAAAFWSLLSPSIDMSASLGMILAYRADHRRAAASSVFGDRLFTRFSERRARSAGKTAAERRASNAVPCWSFPSPSITFPRAWPSGSPLGLWPMGWMAPQRQGPGCWPWALACRICRRAWR